eukprot:753824-Hanusia_phi.AAC.4
MHPCRVTATELPRIRVAPAKTAHALKHILTFVLPSHAQNTKDPQEKAHFFLQVHAAASASEAATRAASAAETHARAPVMEPWAVRYASRARS